METVVLILVVGVMVMPAAAIIHLRRRMRELDAQARFFHGLSCRFSEENAALRKEIQRLHDALDDVRTDGEEWKCR